MSVRTPEYSLERRSLSVRNRKLFVGGLAWYTTSSTLGSFFSQFGTIEEAVVIYDRATSRSKGFGFVTFLEDAAAQKAVENPNPKIDGRIANCNLAIMGMKNRRWAEGAPKPEYADLPQLNYVADCGQDLESSDPILNWEASGSAPT